MESPNVLKRLSDLSQRLANATDLDEASAVAVDAPLELLNARGAALWFFNGAPQSTLVATRGLDKDTLTAVTRDQAQENTFAVDGKNWLMLPLRRNEQLVGALTISLSDDSPTPDQLEVIRAWTYQASAVIESHRMRALETIAFREVDRGVRQDLSVRELMDRLLTQMVSVCEAEGGTIYLFDAKQDHVDAWASYGSPTREEFARTVIVNRRPETMADITGDSDWAIGAPMMLGSRIEGAVVMTRSSRVGAFPPRSIEILSTLSSSAALIVRNAELYARSEEAVIAEERARFASDIHDGLLQDLGFMAFKIAAARKLLQRGKRAQAIKDLSEVAKQLTVDALEVRRMVFALRPFAIESLGFIPAMKKYTKDFAQLHKLEVQLVVTGTPQRLSQKLEMVLFRLIQEALNNVRKHANAEHVWINLEFTGGSVTLSIKDDGRGFMIEDAAKKAHAGSFGLIQMRERVERAGGKFEIATEPGRGARVWLELPMRGP